MKKFFALLLLCVTIVMTSCQKDDPAPSVSGVKISKTTLALTVGAKETLTATISPASVADKSVAWSSSNDLIATVAQNGEVVALGPGTAIITVASVVDKTKTATCEVTVASLPAAVSAVELNRSTVALLIGEKETLIATVLPKEITDKRVTWTSSDARVATVSENGEVTAVAIGTATITATSVADNTQTATCVVTVAKSIIEITNVTIDKQTLSLVVGGKGTLVSTVLPDNASDKSVTWTSSDTAVATVSESGEVTAVAVGTATITVASMDNQTKKAICQVTVTKPAVQVTLVGIDEKPLALLIGGKKTLTATVLPVNATDKNITWTSSDKSVATVSTAGEVVAVGTGVAKIIATSVSDNTKTDECVVTVTAPVVATAAVGNYYYSDKTQTKVYDKTKSCLGVVYWVDPANNQTGKIVSLDEVDLEWGEKLETTGVTNNTNGRANMYQMNKFIQESGNSVWEDYPAFNWVATAKNRRQVGGWADTDLWYLPAQGDLVALFGNDGTTMTAVNAALNSVPGAVALTPVYYCSSTEQDETTAIFVSLSSGYSEHLLKISVNKVRAVANF